MDALSPRPLYLLIFSLCIGLSPHIVRIPVWLSLVAGSAVIYMLASLRWNLGRPKTWVLWLLVLICLAGVAMYYGKIFGRDSGVSLLVTMLSLKLMETRRHRDGMVMAGLIYFSIMTHFLYDQTIPLLVFMIFAVAVNTLALITLNENTLRVGFNRKVHMTGKLLLSALPVMLLLFVLFPRIPGPIWGLPQDSYSARTGLSDRMTLGDISQLAISTEPAFRAVFSGPTPRPDQLYWRTLILGDFDGRTWHVDDKPLLAEPEHLMNIGDAFNYTVTMEPHHKRWLFALDMPVTEKSAALSNGEKLLLTSERLLRTVKPVMTLAQYSITSYPQYRLGSGLNRYQRQRALQLPPDSNPRSLELAQSWRSKTQQPQQLVELALNLFRHDFTYTLTPPVLGRHSIDDFLFESKRGFCEHFAGSFVFLMRAAGVPARVVTGYQGGQFNPLGDYLLVRQSDAHAWAEVWLEKRGWVRVDPTTTVSPARIEFGLEEAIPQSERTGYFYRRDYPLIYKLGLIWDTIDNRWNLWVLGYGPETQFGFLSRLGLSDPDPYKMTFAMLLGTVALLLIIGLLTLRHQRQADDILQKVYLRLCARLSKMGYARSSYEGPLEYAARVKRENPALGSTLEPVLKLYARLRYGQHSLPHGARLLQQKVRYLSRRMEKSGHPA